MLSSLAYSDDQIELYFKNDSVNGLKVSDAYETHNMGFIYSKSDLFYQLDLGIASPDMHVYKNQYRVANRAFGEIISLSVGRKNQVYKDLDLSYHFNLKSSGEYGIDKMQDWMHKILSLQPVNEVNDIVRMPEKVWVGVGARTANNFLGDMKIFNTWGANFYLGTDRMAVTPFLKNSSIFNDFELTQEIGLQIVPFDEIVSAPPISADHRVINPYLEIGLDFEVGAFEFFVKDRFSLPTLANDNSLFGVLHAGMTINLD